MRENWHSRRGGENGEAKDPPRRPKPSVSAGTLEQRVKDLAGLARRADRQKAAAERLTAQALAAKQLYEELRDELEQGLQHAFDPAGSS